MIKDIEELKIERDAVRGRLSAMRKAKMSDVAIVQTEIEKLERLDLIIGRLSVRDTGT